jgi:hypothetical protein
MSAKFSLLKFDRNTLLIFFPLTAKHQIRVNIERHRFCATADAAAAATAVYPPLLHICLFARLFIILLQFFLSLRLQSRCYDILRA